MSGAWNAGLDGASIPQMTPSEARGYFESAYQRNRRAFADMDTAAWLTGHYCAFGVNSPKKYPKKPRLASKMNERQQTIMTDDEMKEAALRFAGRFSNGGRDRSA